MPFNGDAQRRNGIIRSLSRAVVLQSLPVSVRTFPTALCLYWYTAQGRLQQRRLRKGIRYPSYRTVAKKGKYINLVCYSCLKHANEVLLGDPRQADQRAQTFNFSIVNHQPLDGTAQAPSSLPYMQACVNQSSTCSPLSGTNDRLHKRLSLYRRVSHGLGWPANAMFFYNRIREKQFFTLPVVNDNEIVRRTSDGVEGKTGIIRLVRYF